MSNTRTEQSRHHPAAFPVDNVRPADIPILSESLAAHVARRFKRKFFLIEQPERQVANSALQSLLLSARQFRERQLADASDANPRLRLPLPEAPYSEDELISRYSSVVSKAHPLVDAVATAFSQHHPLTLTPDAIWLTIQQGFTHHITQNAESFRHRLVRHSGVERLTAEVPDFTLPSFDLAISAFSAQIRERTDPVLHETLLCDFSTTTATIRTASEVVLMDCYAPFFEYSMMCVCGIPTISVTGTLEDWQRIRDRIDVLETFDLAWWTSRLRLIIDEFIRTIEGNPDLTFWQAIYKPKQVYAATAVGGWIVDLFPYLNAIPTKRRNPAFDQPREDWCLPLEKAVNEKVLPAGLASVPINLKLRSGHLEQKVELVGGFLGLEQDPNDLTLAPLIGWAVAEPPSTKPITL